MLNDKLLSGLKQSLLIPDEVNSFDAVLKTYLTASKSYVDSILDIDKEPTDDDLYILSIQFLAIYYWINRDNPKLKSIPCTVDSLLNRLKTKYHE